MSPTFRARMVGGCDAIVYLITLVVMVLSSHQTVSAVTPIASCTPTFVANITGETYNVVAPLAAAPGMVCISITHPNITVNLNNFPLTGSGGSGIKITADAPSAHVNGPGTISGFATGILDLGPGAILSNLTATLNTQTGVSMIRVNGSVLQASSVVQNGVNGVVLQNTMNCVVQNNFIAGNGNGIKGYGVWIVNVGTSPLSMANQVLSNNIGNANYPGTQVAGIWVGANNNAPLSGCSGTVPSQGNMILSNIQVNSNVKVGIGLQCGSSTANTVNGNSSFLNGARDLFDGNKVPPCDSDSWSSDVFGTRNQACIL